MDTRRDFEVLVVGGGFSGIGLAIKLREAGITDFAILEASEGVGGVWRHNTYPGVAVDIPTTTYCYSFEPNPNWTRAFAPGRELLAYAEHCTDKYGVRPHFRFGTFVERAIFDEAENLWRIYTNRGVFSSRFLIGAVGPLDQPKDPDIEGVRDFRGKRIHTARWDHDHDLRGERVAVIGTGASALQLIPEIARVVSELHVYQRTPIWVAPKMDFAIPPSVHALFRAVPATQSLARLATTISTEVLMVLGVVNYTRLPFLIRLAERRCLRHLREQVPDPVLREKLTPKYPFGCKRPSFSNRYLRTFTKPHVELVTDPIARITDRGIVTRDGRERFIDTLILATGFKILQLGATPAFPVIGVGGVELGEHWHHNRFQNYQGLSVPEAPNFWLMNGPYSVTGASWFTIIEASSRHIVRCLREAKRRGASRMVVKQAPHDAYTERMRTAMKNTVFANPGCATSNSYYFDRHGDAPFVRPHSGLRLDWESNNFPLDDYAYSP
jgi:cation diffusion facilitator CzcD-associated flavoprotein CzcO